ncbi:hypothetical protein K3495_g13532 [Podosphaera aphanis]|nr:hypothetical protein K3495_g13532 [Podosphaera aphanis]
MKSRVPEYTDSSSKSDSTTEEEYFNTFESWEIDSTIDLAEQSEALRKAETRSRLDSKMSTNQQGTEDLTMSDVQNESNTLPAGLSPEEISQLSQIAQVIANAPSGTKQYLEQLINKKTTAPVDSTHGKLLQGVMKKDAKFERWDGKPESWTPHYHLLKVQCRVYQPLLVSEDAVCMKIYESIPEPQRQRIRGYWIKCGESEVFNWEQFLEECNKEYFDKIGAQRAERKLLSMRQGESQIFRNFLQEWELQLEFAGGTAWLDTTKISHLQISTSERLQDKYSVLDLPTDDYREWVKIMTRVAAIMEDRENFIRKDDSQVTQYVTRSGVMPKEYLSGTGTRQKHDQPTPTRTDNKGDVIMSGMKFDLQALTTMVAKINLGNGEKRGPGGFGQKPAAPWRTEAEVRDLREKKLCLRCKKPGHQARFCRTFGPPKQPAQINSVETSSQSPEEFELDPLKD